MESAINFISIRNLAEKLGDTIEDIADSLGAACDDFDDLMWDFNPTLDEEFILKINAINKKCEEVLNNFKQLKKAGLIEKVSEEILNDMCDITELLEELIDE